MRVCKYVVYAPEGRQVAGKHNVCQRESDLLRGFGDKKIEQHLGTAGLKSVSGDVEILVAHADDPRHDVILFQIHRRKVTYDLGAAIDIVGRHRRRLNHPTVSVFISTRATAKNAEATGQTRARHCSALAGIIWRDI
jgi:hypothetical protein